MTCNSRRRLQLSAGLVGAIALAGCAGVMAPVEFESGAPQMRPEQFFAGATTSSGVLESRSGGPTRRLHVEGTGEALADGSFRLDQQVRFGEDQPKTRTWVLRRLDEHRYTATLTDAAGPVQGEAYGDVFHLRYSTRTPVAGEIEQWMYLQPDGRTVLNEATVRVLGATVARLSERITHVDAPSPEQ